jgi:hypothetical protein
MGTTHDRVQIIVIEPQCFGFEHAKFNAALLHTIVLAYPSAKIAFYGEQSHLRHVKDELGKLHSIVKIDSQPIGIADRKSSGWQRMPSEFSLCSRIIDKASQVNAAVLIFFSITNTCLLSLILLMQIKGFKLATLAFVHGCLSNITGRQPRRPWNWIIGLRRVLSLPHHRSLRLVALGDSILDNVKKALPRCKSQWISLDHVYLWPLDQAEISYSQPCTNHRPVYFGYIGVSTKGFDTFCQLAQDIAAPTETAQFIMAGFYNGPTDKKPECQYISDIPNQPLTRKEFEDRIRKLSYVVWTAKPDHYRLTASASFLDALAFLKPGIYLRNDYIEYYFERMGDIGYLCDSYEEMRDTINEIISGFPSIRYGQQVENIRKGRFIFEPETLAPRLRDIVDSCTI